MNRFFNNKTRRTVVSVAVAILILLCCTAAAVAWSDFTQSRTNDFSGTVEKATVTLQKAEKNAEGAIVLRPVKNAEFQLYKQLDDETWQQIGTYYITDTAGEIKVVDLAQGNYKFVETNPGYGYEYDRDDQNQPVTEYPFTITEQDTTAGMLSVSAYNRRLTGSLEISKTVVDGENPQNQPGGSNAPAGTDTTGEDENEPDKEPEEEPTGEPENQPGGNVDNQPETGAENEPDDGSAGNQSGNLDSQPETDNEPTDDPKTSAAANEPQSATSAEAEALSTKKTTTASFLGATKTNATLATPLAVDFDQQFEFTVVFGDGGTYPCQIGSDTISVKSGDKIYLKHGQKAVFDTLPVGLHYEVYETPADGYTTTSYGSVGNIDSGILPNIAKFTNTYEEIEPTPIEIVVEKQIEGDLPDHEKDHLFHFAFYHNDKAPYFFTLKAGEKITFEVNSGDSYRVVELDAFGDGYLLTASVNASGVAGDENFTVTFVNKYVGTVWLDIEGEKTWDLTGDPAASLPAAIGVQLLANGSVVQTVTVTPDADGNWTYKFTAQKYDANDVEITYTVQEVPVPGFASVVTGNDIHNTWITTTVEAPLDVEKKLVGNLPKADDAFEFVLTPINGASMPEQATLTITGEGKASFGDIRFSAAGSYTYLISEVQGSAACQYDTSVYLATIVVEQQDDELVVQSTTYAKVGTTGAYEAAIFTNYYPSPDETSVSVLKLWLGAENQTQPDAVMVQLYQDGEAYGDPVALNAENNRQHVWYNLDKASIWTVDELEVPDGYTKTVAGNQNVGFVIVNAFETPAEDEIVISGVKTWNHKTNPVENRPESITVYVTDGDRVVASKVVTAADSWAWSFTLPKYRQDGITLIEYTIDEQTVSGYTKTVDGTNLINEFDGETPADDTVLVSGVKTWNHKTNPTANRPTSITVYIMDGTRVAASAVITEADHWQWTFKLPKYRADGTEIVYTVDEAAVDGYGKVISGNNIINTFGGETPKDGEIILSGSKTWNYANAPANDRPTSITVLVKNGNKTVREIVVTEADGWSWSIALPQYDANGKAIAYTIDEANVPHYKKAIHGNNIVNTYAGASYPGDSPQTSDGTKLLLWASAAVLSAAMLVALVGVGYHLKKKH